MHPFLDTDFGHNVNVSINFSKKYETRDFTKNSPGENRAVTCGHSVVLMSLQPDQEGNRLQR
jgi:hypothetical protein